MDICLAIVNQLHTVGNLNTNLCLRNYYELVFGVLQWLRIQLEYLFFGQKLP